MPPRPQGNENGRAADAYQEGYGYQEYGAYQEGGQYEESGAYQESGNYQEDGAYQEDQTYSEAFPYEEDNQSAATPTNKGRRRRTKQPELVAVGGAHVGSPNYAPKAACAQQNGSGAAAPAAQSSPGRSMRRKSQPAEESESAPQCGDASSSSAAAVEAAAAAAAEAEAAEATEAAAADSPNAAGQRRRRSYLQSRLSAAEDKQPATSGQLVIVESPQATATSDAQAQAAQEKSFVGTLDMTPPARDSQANDRSAQERAAEVFLQLRAARSGLKMARATRQSLDASDLPADEALPLLKEIHSITRELLTGLGGLQPWKTPPPPPPGPPPRRRSTGDIGDVKAAAQEGEVEELRAKLREAEQRLAQAGLSPQPVGPRTTEVVVAVRSGPEGLGIILNDSNRVTRIVPGGQAEADRVVKVGDVVSAINGESLGQRTLAEALPPGLNEYAFTIARGTPGTWTGTPAQLQKEIAEIEKKTQPTPSPSLKKSSSLVAFMAKKASSFGAAIDKIQ